MGVSGQRHAPSALYSSGKALIYILLGKECLPKCQKVCFAESLKAGYPCLKEYQQAGKVLCAIYFLSSRELITFITTTYHWTLSWACFTQFRSSQSIFRKLYANIILPSFLCVADPRTAKWPLMSSPFPTLAICLSYVYVVKVLGPKLMENKKPMELRKVLIYYNLFQVLFSIWLFYEVSSCNVTLSLLCAFCHLTH
jgi:hypothetical protein